MRTPSRGAPAAAAKEGVVDEGVVVVVPAFAEVVALLAVDVPFPIVVVAALAVVVALLAVVVPFPIVVVATLAVVVALLAVVVTVLTVVVTVLTVVVTVLAVVVTVLAVVVMLGVDNNLPKGFSYRESQSIIILHKLTYI